MKRARSLAVPLARSLAASFVVLAFVAPSAMAASMSEQTTWDERNILRGVVYYSYPRGDQEIPVTIVSDQGSVVVPNAKFQAQEAPGFTVSYERKLVDFLGVNLGVSWVRYDFETTIDVTDTQTTFARLGKQTVIPITGTVLWHPFKRPVVDWYIGGGYSYVWYGDFHNGYTGDSFEADSDTGFVAQTGFDAVMSGNGSKRKPQGTRWAVNLDVRYIDTSSNGQISSQGIEISPIDISLGVSARF